MKVIKIAKFRPNFILFFNAAFRECQGSQGSTPAQMSANRHTPMKRAKWHLGIRSQSKPHDIMNEVYRAMKALNFVSIHLT